ncbi:MAG: hypothetical protein APR63_04580 [Desulfuromonas sp. SDB]|nr:MAG: hypothetical protein APR63_04580 [Desulfuromonas sp. SDB]
MRNLIPNFIKQKYSLQQHSGSSKAFTLILDVSGFTKMTNKLIENEVEGVEILSGLINQIFSKAIETVYAQGGFISDFSGDGFNAIFPLEKVEISNILYAAALIMNDFLNFQKIETKFGKFTIKAKIGISFGSISWEIFTNRFQNVYLFKGEAMVRANYFQNIADPGEIVVDFSLINNFQEVSSFMVKMDNKYLLKIPEILKELKPQSKEIQDFSIPDQGWVDSAVQEKKTPGEFRVIVSCFIVFQESFINSENLNKFIELVYQYGGYLNKLSFSSQGGMVLVIFGAPLQSEKFIYRAVDFSLALRTAFSSQLKIALSYGKTFCGFMGNAIRSEYTAIGQVVNISSRLIGESDWNEILVDEQVYINIKMDYNVLFQDEIVFRGFSKPQKIYLLKKRISELAEEPKHEKISLIDRHREFTKLEQIVNEFINSKQQKVVMIKGDAGAGKSFLIRKLKNKTNNKNLIWAHLICDQILAKPYNSVIYFLKNYFQQSPEKSEHLNKVKFEEILHSLQEDISAIDQDFSVQLYDTRSFLGSLININWENSTFNNLEPRDKQQAKVNALNLLFTAISRIKPLLIYIEDFNWIDHSTLTYFEQLLMNYQDLPLLFLLEMRTDKNFRNDKIFPHQQKIELFMKNLTPEYSEQMIESILNHHYGKRIRVGDYSRLKKLILNKSEGNPFFIFQLMEYLSERKELEVESPDSVNLVPDSILSLIQIRIDLLPWSLREIAEIASIMGREFDMEILEQAAVRLGLNYNFKSEIERGVENNIWKKMTKLRYSFSHSLIRDAVYQMQLKSRIRKIHQIIAELMEQYYSQQGNYFMDIADHFSKAENVEKEKDYLYKAAKFAKDNYQNDVAIDLYQKYLCITDQDNPMQMEVLLDLCDIYILTGSWSKAEHFCRRVRELAQQINSVEYDVRSCNLLGSLYRLQGKYEQGLELLKHSDKLLENNHDDVLSAETAVVSAHIFYRMGNYRLAEKNYQKGLNLCKQANFPRKVSNILVNLAHIHSEQGNYSEALEIYEQSLNISREINDQKNIANVMMGIGIIHHLNNQYREAAEKYQKSRRIKEVIGDQQGLSIILTNIGSIHQDLGDFDQAYNCYDQSLKISRKLNDQRSESINLSNIGAVYKCKEEFNTSMKYYNQAIDICKSLGVKYNLCNLYLEKAQLLSSMGKYSDASEYISKSAEIAEEVNRESVIKMAMIERLKINYFTADSKQQKEIAIKSLIDYSNELDESEYFGLLNYEIFKISGEDVYRQKALTIYNDLFSKAEKFEYRQIIDQLSK